MDGKNRKVYTVPEVAEQLGISRAAGYQLAKQQVFPTIRFGRRVVVHKERFEEWLRDNSKQMIQETTSTV